MTREELANRIAREMSDGITLYGLGFGLRLFDIFHTIASEDESGEAARAVADAVGVAATPHWWCPPCRQWIGPNFHACDGCGRTNTLVPESRITSKR